MKTNVTSESVEFEVRTVAPLTGFGVQFVSGSLNLMDGVGDYTVSIATGLLVNTWYYIEMEWRSAPSYQSRARVDGGTWTDWTGTLNAGPYIIFKMRSYLTSATTCYIDSITQDLDIIMPATVGSFSLTGVDTLFGISMVAGTGSFTLTGVDATFTKTTPWAFQTKNTTSWTWQDKS